MAHLINNIYTQGANIAKYDYGIDDTIDENLLNPILRSDYRLVGNEFVKKKVDYKCGLNEYKSINEKTGRIQKIKGIVTRTDLDSRYCNNALSWVKNEHPRMSESNEKFLNRSFRPQNGMKNQSLYNNEKYLLEQRLRDNDLTYDQYVYLLERLKIRNGLDKTNFYVEPYRCEYDEHNKVSMYRMFRAIRNLELEMDHMKLKYEAEIEELKKKLPK